MREVALVVFQGVQSLDVFGPLDVFAEANRFLMPSEHYSLKLVGADPGPVRCSNGATIVPDLYYAESSECFVLLLVAGGPSLPRRAKDQAFSRWLAEASERSKKFGSICNGAFLLGHAGLLRERRVTTHWNDASRLSECFPEATVESDRIYLSDGKLYTSARVTAGIDLSLFLLSEDVGAEVSLNVAKRLVVYTQRSGGQSQFSPYLTHYVMEESPVSIAQRFVLENLTHNLSVEALAAVVSMSPRNFARVFVRDARITPANFMEGARLDAARVLLEGSDEPMKAVAFRCGFASPNQMRLVFQRRLGVSAQQYRENFRRVQRRDVPAG
ncbi:GlxA family transcriptional regulator [Burkholderia sp. Bp9015]|uniref:GlxA family transcriptional regulator n=1 Tax=Burkholderia sp. Bp9015 TaxID=2184563 RepID=UPI000F599247|nr:DJ-1/PfpI family protein [Burkholderia sp. Bp9015]RQR74800.1 helix-turn-helix domain-containing protein [Burkholderia sp. Bp9015]